jgi:hypothetical protein
VESVGAQLAVATSVPGLLDLADLRSTHEYFELLQRGGVIGKDQYVTNGVGAGIATFNTIFTAVQANRENTAIKLEDFGKVSSIILNS